MPGDWFVLRRDNAQAFGRPVTDGFLIRKGSTAVVSGKPNEKRYREQRDDLVRRGVLVLDPRHDLYFFADDHVFESPSAAAGIVIDGNASGPQLWIDPKSKRTLKDVLGSK